MLVIVPDIAGAQKIVGRAVSNPLWFFKSDVQPALATPEQQHLLLVDSALAATFLSASDPALVALGQDVRLRNTRPSGIFLHRNLTDRQMRALAAAALRTERGQDASG
jgi:hypothetical protein